MDEGLAGGLDGWMEAGFDESKLYTQGWCANVLFWWRVELSRDDMEDRLVAGSTI